MLKKISNRLSCYIWNIEIGDFYKISIYNTRVDIICGIKGNIESAKEEMMDKLKNAVFDPVFNHFLQVMTDGNFINLTEDKLKLIDQIDIFYSGKESQLPVSKPFFIKLALNYLGDKLVEFNKLPSNSNYSAIALHP